MSLSHAKHSPYTITPLYHCISHVFLYPGTSVGLLSSLYRFITASLYHSISVSWYQIAGLSLHHYSVMCVQKLLKKSCGNGRNLPYRNKDGDYVIEIMIRYNVQEQFWKIHQNYEEKRKIE